MQAYSLANRSRERADVRRTLVRSEELFVNGQEAEYYFKIVSGTVRTYRLMSDGRRQIDAFHLPGDILGLDSGKTYCLSAQSVDCCIVNVYRRSDLAALAADDPCFGDQIIASIMASLERAYDHMLLLGCKTSQEKVATFLLNMATRLASGDHFDLPMQRSDIADHLGVTIETVSRTLTQMVKDGVIELPVSSRSVVLRDIDALRRLKA